MVIAGDFNQDLSTMNDLSSYLLKSMNGIDHGQEEVHEEVEADQSRGRKWWAAGNCRFRVSRARVV